jgi:hypothetical protein
MVYPQIHNPRAERPLVSTSVDVQFAKILYSAHHKSSTNSVLYIGDAMTFKNVLAR